MLGAPFAVGITAEADRPQGKMVAVRDCAAPLAGGEHRRLQVLGHLQQRLVGVGRMDAAARPDRRVGRRGDQLCRARDFRVAGRRTHAVRRVEQLDLRLLGQCFGRNLDLHRARPARPQLHERLVHALRGIRGVHDPFPPLDHRAHGVELIVDLVQHPAVDADHVAFHLTGDHQHRRRRRVGGADAGRGVLQPRPRHHQRRADAGAGARVAVRHVGGGLLVAGGDEANLLLFGESVEQVVELYAGQAEDHPYPLAMKLSGERLSAGHPGHDW